jgi:hypothetical protein
MFYIQTFTAKADFAEDRIRLDAVDPEGSIQQIHVTRRLADRFVPLLLERVEETAAAGKAREIDLAMRQERLRNERNDNPIAEVETRQDARRWLCLTMHLGVEGGNLNWRLTDEAGNDAFMALVGELPRTVLDIFLLIYRQLEWDTAVFPEWLKEVGRNNDNQPRVLN